MPRFAILSPEVKKRVLDYFADKPVGTKIKYGASVKTTKGEPRYILKNSYVKLETDIFVFSKGEEHIIGRGSFGKVKYAQSLSSDAIYVVKTIPFHDIKGKELINSELKSLYDLGLYRDTGLRKSAISSKQYIVMLNAGLSLKDYCKHPALSDGGRIDLAIQFLWAVYKFHQGLSTRSLKGLAHRDIKPDNITITSSGDVRLIDVGFSTYDLDVHPPEVIGAPLYLPNIMTFAQGITLRQCDILATKRVIYMPNKVFFLDGYKEDLAHKHFEMMSILTEPLLETLKVLSYFDTSALPGQCALKAKDYNSDPMVLAAVLILARYRLIEEYAFALEYPIVTHAILGMYFALYNGADERVAGLISSGIRAYCRLRTLTARHKALSDEIELYALLIQHGITTNLMKAIPNSTLIALLTHDSLLIQRTAALLWQNGFCENAYLKQINNNEELANIIIDLLFDGKLDQVRKILEEPTEKTSARMDSRLPLLSAVHTSEPCVVEPVTSGKIRTVLSALFFAPPVPKLEESGLVAAGMVGLSGGLRGG